MLGCGVRENRKNRGRGCLGLTGVLLAVVMAGSWIFHEEIDFSRFFLRGHRTTEFSSKSWRRADSSSYMSRIRLRMVDDLLERNHLSGLERPAVVDLPGPPDGDPYLLEEQPRHEGSFIYRSALITWDLIPCGWSSSWILAVLRVSKS